MEKVKSGFVAIIGRPNVGKSTLLNTILNKKIAIVTAKAQTTRNKIQGIYNDDDSQIVFLDTPGVHKPHHEMGKYMNKVALSATKGVDVILLLSPANEDYRENDQFIMNVIKERQIPTILAITKADLVKSDQLLLKIDEWKQRYDFEEIIPISSLKFLNIDKLITLIKNKLPLGNRYYPDDMLTDQPEIFLIREIIREKILLLTEEEIPHSVAILVDKIEDKPNILKIIATICVERKSQKGILIGKNGSMLKNIGTQARIELETMLNQRIYLELFVKIVEKWRDKASMVARLGYNKETY